MNKINMSFFNAYLELDKICAQRLEINRGGVSAYIGRLVELRFAPNRSEVLPRLLKYRKLRNIIAHEEGAFAELDEITKADVVWLNRFARSVSRGSDPVSRYERKARNYALWRRLRVAFIFIIALAVLAVAFVILKDLGNI